MAQQKFDWQAIDTVILDLDGTLIDLYFDHRFWKKGGAAGVCRQIQAFCGTKSRTDPSSLSAGGIQYAMVLH